MDHSKCNGRHKEPIDSLEHMRSEGKTDADIVSWATMREKQPKKHRSQSRITHRAHGKWWYLKIIDYIISPLLRPKI